jgi:serine/threonine protein kinase
MSLDDESLGKVLLQHGLLSEEEFEDAASVKESTGRPLEEILVEKAYLSRVQIEDVQAALQRRVRFCAPCRQPVFVPRVRDDGERCPRCLGALSWKEEAPAGPVESHDSIVELTRDSLPAEVDAARVIPSRVFGKYVLLEEVGRGGAGVVQKAWDTMLGEYVALKFIRMPRGMAGDTQVMMRQRQTKVLDLLQEARAAVRLRHPHIIPIRDVGEINQQFYISMDFIEGETLADRIRAAQARGRLSALYEDPAFHLAVLRDISSAIHYAHTFPTPIVHCDLKPSNVLISSSRVAYVMDFGLARALDGSREGELIVRGTPAYMAPEQLSGRPEDIGPWTDIYAIGGILYELLTGRQIFSGETTPEVIYRTRRETPQTPSEVIRQSEEMRRGDTSRILEKSTRLEAICMKCLAKSPKDRYATAREVAEELEVVLGALESRDPRQETKVVPTALREARDRAEMKRVDDHITQMDLEKALKEADALEEARHESDVRHWVADRRKQVDTLEKFRARLVDRVNDKRPRLPLLKLVSGQLENVELLKATQKKLFVFVGDRSMELEWSSLSLAQVVGLAQAVGMNDPEDRLALSIICHHAGFVELKTGFLMSLMGTPLEAAARHFLEAK